MSFKIYVDMDSTLVDLMSNWIDWLNKEKSVKVTTKEIIHWDYIAETFGEEANNFWKTKGVYNNVKPINGSVEFMYILQKMYDKENVVIISKCVKSNYDEKVKYAEKYFNILPNNFINASDKWQFTSDGILIDDAPHNVIEHSIKNEKPSILFNYRNRYGWANLNKEHKLITKCKDYSECLKVIKSSEKYFKEV